ncbi:transposable element Tcb1 transposase [Trichonephila clavipes]|nr:transposable element Tcb1 transposase [Trichonephila clavipes]
MLNSCVMHRHTGPAPSNMVWSGIEYHNRTLLVRIAGTLNSQRYISEVLEAIVLPYLQGLDMAIFRQDNAGRGAIKIMTENWVTSIESMRSTALVRLNSWDTQLAIRNDPRYARLETNLGIG